MYKTTRAYLCQAVVDPNPLSRIASTVFGQARQALDKVFRRAARQDGQTFASRIEPTVQTVASRSLISAVRSGSRSVLSNFVARNYQSELVTAMKQKYPFRFVARGFYGRRLPGYAFVGIGVAAGAQWSSLDEEDNDVHYDSVFKNVYDMMGRYAKVSRSESETRETTLPMTGEWQFNCPLDENAEMYEDDEPQFDFVVIEEEESDHSSDIVIINEDETQQNDSTVFLFSSLDNQKNEIEVEQCQLLAELNAAIVVTGEHEQSLKTVEASILLLNTLLKELVAKEDIEADVIPAACTSEEAPIVPQTVATADSCLTVIGQQEQQLQLLSGILFQQFEQLQQLTVIEEKERKRQSSTRCSHCKKDTCCGPGVCCGPGGKVD